jgi:hypothetical protein
VKQASHSDERDTLGFVPNPPPAERRLAMFHVGLDVHFVHSKRSSIYILDQDGKPVKQFEVKGPWPQLLHRVAQEVPRPFWVCFEASCGYGSPVWIPAYR